MQGNRVLLTNLGTVPFLSAHFSSAHHGCSRNWGPAQCDLASSETLWCWNYYCCCCCCWCTFYRWSRCVLSSLRQRDPWRGAPVYAPNVEHSLPCRSLFAHARTTFEHFHGWVNSQDRDRVPLWFKISSLSWLRLRCIWYTDKLQGCSQRRYRRRQILELFHMIKKWIQYT